MTLHNIHDLNHSFIKKFWLHNIHDLNHSFIKKFW
jgi:hypothetical protein